MPSVHEFGAKFNVSVGEVIKIGETQVRNPNSALFKAIEERLSKKLAALAAKEEAEGSPKRKQRVYIQHCVDNMERYKLTATFPQWDVRFSGVDRRAAAFAHAAYTCVSELLINKANASGLNTREVLAYGISLKQIIMRGRGWLHVCVPGHVVEVQAEFMRDDRAIVAITNNLHKQGKNSSLARKYVTADDCQSYCGHPGTCKRQSPIAILMLHKTDTNLRQIAYYMRQHGVRLLYYAIPGSKHMELGTSGAFDELGAYVFPSNDGKKINITYKGDTTLDMAYTYSNYLELVARTEVTIDGVCYHKEFEARVLGTLVYKVTAFETSQDIDRTIPLYRSWVEPEYRGKYIVHAPLLKPFGNANNPKDWELRFVTIDRSHIDEVLDYAIRADGVADMIGIVKRRLNSRLNNVLLQGQILPANQQMAVVEYDLVSQTVFTVAFMRKYVDGKTVATLAPHARELAKLSRASSFGMAGMYIMSRLKHVSTLADTAVAEIRKAYYGILAEDAIPLPSFTLLAGFVEYSDTASSNPRFQGWASGADPVSGFSPMLPTVKSVALPIDEAMSTTSVVSDSGDSYKTWALYSGQGYVDESGRFRESDTSVQSTSMLGWVKGLINSGDPVAAFDTTAYVEAIPPDIPSQSESDSGVETDSVDSSVVQPVQESFLGSSSYVDSVRFNSAVDTTYELRSKYRSHDPAVNALVNRIADSNYNLQDLRDSEYTAVRRLHDRDIPTVVLGSFSDMPVEDVRDALNIMFPGSLTMTTRYMQGDITYSNVDIRMKGARGKVDVSKMEPLKPENIFLPVLSSHTMPNARNNTVNTLLTVEKRNANTPADADDLDVNSVAEQCFRDYLKVFCVVDAAIRLEKMDCIGPTEESIREFVSALPEEKRQRLLSSPEDFTFTDMSFMLQNNQFMLKDKLKPELGAAYATAFKLPQSIQYDSSGKSVGVYTPIVSQKVKREQSLLKSNVLIMQNKSMADVNHFLNGFDHRPDERGERLYLEGDYTQFDKTQAEMAMGLNWKNWEKYKVLPAYLNFFKGFTTERSLSALKAGVKVWIRNQRPTGLSHTLDGNNDVNKMVISGFLLEIIDKVEFIIMMGDDFLVAIRGIVDVSTWEAEINRKYNLSIKLGIHRHGYICSMDVVHYPDGRSRVIPDVVKRALALTSQSEKVEEKFEEKFVSYADNMDGIQDVRVQQYLCSALPGRMRKYLPTVTAEAIHLLVKAHARLRVNFSLFRRMYAAQTTIIFQ